VAEQAPFTWGDFQAKLVAKAWKDEAFAQELRTNPKAAVERELARLRPGATLPENIQVQVVEETPTTLYLVVPPGPRRPETGELSDEDLERAAGGFDIWSILDPRPTCKC
jgi:hypothetical protein